MTKVKTKKRFKKETLNLRIMKTVWRQIISRIKKKISGTKNKFSIDSPKGVQKEFIRNHKSILKTQQWFKSDRHNNFTEESSWFKLKWS